MPGDRHERWASAFHLLSLSLSLSTIAQTAKKLLAVCDDEWKSLVIFRFYIGARLGDLAMLTWQNLGLGSNEPYYTSRKTQRSVIVPLANALRAAPAL